MTEEDILNRTLEFLSPTIGSLDYRGFDYPLSVVKNENRLHNMFESGDMTFHTGVLLRALAWRWKVKRDPKDLQSTLHILINYFRWTQNENNGCLVRSVTRKDGYDQFPPQEMNGFTKANFWGDASPIGSMRYKEVVHPKDGVTYYLRYDISIDAIISALCGMYWMHKFGTEAHKDIIKKIASDQLDYYTKTNWRVVDKNTGDLLRYGRHWRINPVGNMLRKILLFLATGEKEKLVFGMGDWLLNNLYSRVPLLMNSDQRQFNNYMIISAACVLQDMGYDCSNTIKNLWSETKGTLHYLNNKIANHFLDEEALVIKEVPITTFHSMTYVEQKKVVPHGLRYRSYNVWEENSHRLAAGREDAILPQAWWLELYWCYEE